MWDKQLCSNHTRLEEQPSTSLKLQGCEVQGEEVQELDEESWMLTLATVDLQFDVTDAGCLLATCRLGWKLLRNFKNMLDGGPF